MARGRRHSQVSRWLPPLILLVFLGGLLLGLWLGKRESYRLGYLAGRAAAILK